LINQDFLHFRMAPSLRSDNPPVSAPASPLVSTTLCLPTSMAPLRLPHPLYLILIGVLAASVSVAGVHELQARQPLAVSAKH
jgi:hypothetical protein